MFLNEEELINTPTPTKEAPENYQLSNSQNFGSDLDDDIGGLVGEMNGQSQQVNDSDYDVEIPDFEPEIEKTSVDPAKQRLGNDTATFVVSQADNIISRALASYAHTDYRDLAADNSELKEIAKHFAPYFVNSDFNMPPWVMGVIAAGYVMFDKFKAASAIRKANMEAEAHKAKVAELEKEIDKLTKEKKVEDLKKEVNHLRIVK